MKNVTATAIVLPIIVLPIIIKKIQVIINSSPKMTQEAESITSTASRIRKELVSRGLIEKDEHGDDTPYYIEVKPQYIEIRSWTSQGCVRIDC